MDQKNNRKSRTSAENTSQGPCTQPGADFNLLLFRLLFLLPLLLFLFVLLLLYAN